MEAIWKTTRIIGLTCCFALIAAVSVDRVTGTDSDKDVVQSPKEEQALVPSFSQVDDVPALGKVATEGRRSALGGGNDDCVGATAIGDGSFAFDTTGATLDGSAPVPCDGNMDEDVWFLYTATCTGLATIASGCADEPEPDTTLEVFGEGTCPPSTTIGCADDSCGTGFGYASTVDVFVAQGEDYLIRIGGWNGGAAAGTLVTSCAGSEGYCAEPSFTNCLGGEDVCGAHVGSPDDSISNVTYAGINNDTLSEDCPNSYGDYTAQKATVAPGESNEICVSFCSEDNWTQCVTVWIDWNQDEVLDNGAERYELGCGVDATLCLDIVTPEDAAAGETRMRVIESWTDPEDDACDPSTTSFGETEDYTVTVESGVEGDDCGSALVIPSVPFADGGDTCEAADDYDAVCPFLAPGSSDIVYEYTPTEDLECINIDLCASKYDTKVYVFEASCDGDPIACNDDTADCGNFASLLTGVLLNGGTTYYIVVDGFGGDCGAYALDISTCPLPAENDDCAERIEIFDGDTEFNTSAATTDGLPHLEQCDDTANGQTVNDIWYNYNSTCTGTLTVSTCGQADYDTDIVIYGGEGACDIANCPPGDEFVVACNDDFSGCSNFTSSAAVSVEEGNCYKIRVGGWDLDTDRGTGTITVSCTDPFCGDTLCGEGENCANCTADCGGCCGADGDGDGDLCDESLGEFCYNCIEDCGPCEGLECPETNCDCTGCMVTQSNHPLTAANEQVACGSSLGTTENGWARCFNHAEEGISGDLTINSVTFGVQQATIDDIPINVNIYTDGNGCPPDEPDVDATLIAQESLTVGTADIGTFITVAFPGIVIPAGTDFIVEVEAPISGSVPEPDNYSFRSMANNGGQCNSNYLRAASCGISFWIAMDAIGFPNTHFALSINGGDDATGCPEGELCDEETGECFNPSVERSLIIKQGACPAPVNPNSNGVIPMLLVGDADFDVNAVDLDSLSLSRCDGEGGSATPLADHTQVKDLNHPGDSVECGGCQCNDDQSSDGIDDLSMKFRTDETLAALGIGAGDGVVTVQLTGNLLDGSAFHALDCLMVVPPGSGAINATMQSNVPDTFIEMTPLDLNVDSDGFADFTRTFIEGTTLTLTAPSTSKGRRFLRWNVDGQMQGFGVRTIDVVIGADTTLKAFYQRPGRVVPELPTEGDGDME